MSEVDAQIAGLRADLRVVSDSELASILGLGRSAVSQWRKRGSVPRSALAKAALTSAHITLFEQAAHQVTRLGHEELAFARALAIAFVYQQAEKGPTAMEFELPRLAGAFDAITIAAARAMRETGFDQFSAFGTLLLKDNLERVMLSKLLPSLLPQ